MNVASYIDHTALKAETTLSDIKQLCEEAKQYGFYSVCVNSCYASVSKEYLSNSPVLVCCVIGFPLGSCTMEAKAYETTDAIKNGATEIDMVINVGALKEKRYDYVLEDIKAVTNAANGKAIVKVILETCLLTDDEIIKACELCLQANADFVKTSTGFNKAGATIKHVSLMKSVVKDRAKVKAAGGVRDYETAIAFIKAGASRLGCSSSIKIINGETIDGDY